MVAHNTENLKHRIVKRCEHCGTNYDIFLCYEDFFAWQNNEGFIQELMPYLTPGERELIISGTCDRCWELMFDSFEEDEV